MKLAAALVALLLAGCGGGGGNSAVSSSGWRPGIEFGYYWTDPGQIAATAPHVTFVHAHDGGDWSTPASREAIAQRIIEQMQDARARGVPWVILSTGWLTLDAACNYRGTTDLVAFRARLEALDLVRSVVAFYPRDEPNIGCTDATITTLFNATRDAWPGPKVAVVYSGAGTFPERPGIEAADWVGVDDYGTGKPLLPAVRADQSLIILPGGGDPWRTDPAGFQTIAFADRRVGVVWAFLYADRTDGQGLHRGIGTNGEAPRYAAAGLCIGTGKC